MSNSSVGEIFANCKTWFFSKGNEFGRNLSDVSCHDRKHVSINIPTLYLGLSLICNITFSVI